MGAFVMAWLIGEGIISWRVVKNTGAPPLPGQLLASSGIFAGLALLAEAEQARPFAVTLAYAFDFAAFMNLVPAVTGGTGKVSAAAPSGQTAAAAGGAG